VQLWTFMPGLNAGPYIQWSLEFGPMNNTGWTYTSNSLSSAAGGNTSTTPLLCMVFGASSAWTSLTGGTTPGATVGSPIVPPYTRIKMWNSASITTLTAADAGLWLYGIRW
jgi:hypothetical protein